MVPQHSQLALLPQALLVFQVPVIGFIGRLDFQKGADLVLGAAKWLLETQDVQLICLGTGDASLEVTHSHCSRLHTSCLLMVVLGRMSDLSNPSDPGGALLSLRAVHLTRKSLLSCTSSSQTSKRNSCSALSPHSVRHTGQIAFGWHILPDFCRSGPQGLFQHTQDAACQLFMVVALIFNIQCAARRGCPARKQRDNLGQPIHHGCYSALLSSPASPLNSHVSPGKARPR